MWQLENGLAFKTLSYRLIHKEFSIWSFRNNLWIRVSLNKGFISGFKTSDQMIAFLEKYNFELIGKYDFIPINKEINETNISGAL